MRKVFLFMMISLDGYFEGEDHDLSWHNVDEEFNEFAIAQTNNVGTLLFGRKTYELMASYWSSEPALETDPVVAKQMNETSKMVFSHTLNKADWQNTKLVSDDAAEAVRQLKTQPGKEIGIYGSNNLCVSLMRDGLVDEFRIMVNPVVIGKGTLLFAGINNKVDLKLIDTRKFASGNVLLTYQPV
jgi:dihydrofolate reductase